MGSRESWSVTGCEVVHFTTVHSRRDTRVRIKEVTSLATMTNAPTCLFVQDGLGEERDQNGNFDVHDTGAPTGNRLARMFLGSFRMWREVRRARPALAHFHDSELIPVGIMLKLSGVHVVYDVHEDLPRQILSKHWIPALLRHPVSWAAAFAEWLAGRVFDAIIAATPVIANNFPQAKTEIVQNFPILSELLAADNVPYHTRPSYFVYVGGMTVIRGIREIVEAISVVKQSDSRLILAGGFQPPSLQSEVEGMGGWRRTVFEGWADRKKVAEILGSVRAGLVLFHPEPNHISAQPNKLFEYMSAGIPVIASDFPLWREIVEGAGCGLLVDPLDSKAIGEAMQWILDNPDEAAAMGQRGRKAVEEIYNWESESKKLIALYERLLKDERKPA